MPVSISHRLSRAPLALLGLAALCTVLGGCASVSDTISPAFVDPARYELWDCKQLAPERRNLAKRLQDQERLMAKAETGAGGAVVSELAYRNEYISIRGQQNLLEETWRKNRCRESDMEAAPPAQPAPASAPANADRPPRPGLGTRSGSAIY
jgi:hypothetical protein